MRTSGAIRKVEILKSVLTVGKTGSKKSSWSNLFGNGSYLWSRVNYNSQRMTARNGNYVLTSSVTFTIRYYPDITEYNRVKWEDRQYRINSIERYPERNEMRINADLIDE